MRKTKDEIIEYINSLQNYQGYVQFSDRPIEDIWTSYSDILIETKDGFVHEAHFCNKEQSISVKQINESWFVSITDISNIKEEDKQIYFAKDTNVKMAQIWEEESDEFCEGMSVEKLKKVVFAGFVGGGR